VRMTGIVVTVDTQSRQAERIERLQVSHGEPGGPSYDSDDGRPEYFNAF
jgi:hypothetical protein